ncbi:hypothetical protein DSO57_1016939 [Entomophthora muscae]|uniref:Uncharacterized protein n=1 Tax=Entomophthora muscae TaxID=34485 RepID=A0ACC2TFR7_9FUNG|nr:hypothetical protein DSO57_1016939 [Entomophthora muscae]
MEWIGTLQILTAVLSFSVNIILLICNYHRGKERWSTDGILITINAVLDCILSWYLIIADLFRISNPSLVYDGSPWCHVTFIFERAIGTSCLNVVMLLSVVRYLVIVQKKNSNRIVWTGATMALIFGLLTVTLIRSSNTKLHVYPSGMYCYPISTEEGKVESITYFVYLLFYVPHMFIIPFCYFCISRHYSLIISTFDMTHFNLPTRIQAKVFGLAAVAVAYWACIMPHIIIVQSIYILNTKPPPLLDGLLYWLKGCFLLINAIFPLLFHTEIQNNFYSTFVIQEPSRPYNSYP